MPAVPLRAPDGGMARRPRLRLSRSIRCAQECRDGLPEKRPIKVGFVVVAVSCVSGLVAAFFKGVLFGPS